MTTLATHEPLAVILGDHYLEAITFNAMWASNRFLVFGLSRL